MFDYLLPVQSVLLEYVIKLGDVIFFPANASVEDITRSTLTDAENETLKNILEKNYKLFTELGNCAFLLLSSEFDSKNIQSDINILEKIFSAVFFSKEIRTEVVHKGRKIDELVALDRAKDMNQSLFNICIFC